jgi:hypothetical protein
LRILRILLALVHIGVGGVCSLLALPYVAIFLGADGIPNPTQVRFGQEFAPNVFLYFLPSLIGGIGLLFDAIWARRLLLLQAVAYLFLTPLGTLLGLAGLVILLFDPAARFGVREPPPGQVNVILTIAMVGSGMLAGLLALFRYHGDVPPMGLDGLLYPSAALFALALVLFLVRVVPGWSYGRGEWRAWTPSAPVNPAYAATRRERLARLAADPATAPYARRIEAGESWSDAQIAYDRDPARLASCIHLQPIEADLRRGGYRMRLGNNAYVEADCFIDPAAIQRQYRLAPPAEYIVYPPERDGADETPAVRCTEHGFAIIASRDQRARRFP